MPLTQDELVKKLRAARGGFTRELEWHQLAMDSYTGQGGYGGRIQQPREAFLGWAAEVYSRRFLEQYIDEADPRYQGKMASDRYSYLDRYPREEQDKYDRRKELAHYQNHVQGIFDVLMGYIFEQEPTYDGVGAKTKAWMERSRWSERRQAFLRRACLLGWMPALVDLPNAAPKTAAERLEPTLLALFPANLLDFAATSTDDGDGIGTRFDWAKLRTDHISRKTPLDDPTEVEEYGLWFPDHVDRYEVVKRADRSQSVNGPERVDHPFSTVPIVIWSCKLGVEGDEALGLGLVDAAISEARRHFNLLSELDEMLRSGVFPMLQIPYHGDTPPTELTIGNGNGLPLHNLCTHEYKHVEPAGASAETYENRLESTVAEMYRTQNVSRDTNEGRVESGVARAYSFERTNITLKNITKQCARGESDTLRLVAAAFGEREAEIKVTPPTEFRITELLDELANLEAAARAQIPRTALKLVKRRVVRKMVPNLTEDEAKVIDSELDQQVKDDAQRSAAELDLVKAGGEPPL